jgi:toxin FitB
MNVIDSSCWIEFLLGSEQGKFVEPIVKHEALLLVPAIALFEVHKFLSRQALSQVQLNHCLEEMQRGRVVELTAARAIAASAAAQTHQLAMADAIMYSIATEFKATLWTQDADYQGLPHVQYKAK